MQRAVEEGVRIYYYNKKNLILLMKKYGFEAVQYNGNDVFDICDILHIIGNVAMPTNGDLFLLEMCVCI